MASPPWTGDEERENRLRHESGVAGVLVEVEKPEKSKRELRFGVLSISKGNISKIKKTHLY